MAAPTESRTPHGHRANIAHSWFGHLSPPRLLEAAWLNRRQIRKSWKEQKLLQEKAKPIRVIGTLRGLYPKRDNTWEYHMHRYSLLDTLQKAAVARFLVELPKLVELSSEDQKTAERALRNYWGEYLPSPKSN